MSKVPNGAGIRPEPCRASQLRVKLGTNSAANQHDQKDDRANAEPGRIVGRTVKMRLEMEGDIARGKHRHDRHHLEIAPIPSGEDLARDNGRHHEKKCDIDNRRRKPSDPGRNRHRQAAGDPDQHEDEKRSALERHPSGPVRDRREQESGDDSRHVAEEHLVDVPVAAHRQRIGSHTRIAPPAYTAPSRKNGRKP